MTDQATLEKRILMAAMVRLCEEIDDLQRTVKSLDERRALLQGDIYEIRTYQTTLLAWIMRLEAEVGPERVKELAHHEILRTVSGDSRPRFRVRAGRRRMARRWRKS